MNSLLILIASCLAAMGFSALMLILFRSVLRSLLQTHGFIRISGSLVASLFYIAGILAFTRDAVALLIYFLNFSKNTVLICLLISVAIPTGFLRER